MAEHTDGKSIIEGAMQLLEKLDQAATAANAGPPQTAPEVVPAPTATLPATAGADGTGVQRASGVHGPADVDGGAAMDDALPAGDGGSRCRAGRFRRR